MRVYEPVDYDSKSTPPLEAGFDAQRADSEAGEGLDAACGGEVCSEAREGLDAACGGEVCSEAGEGADAACGGEVYDAEEALKIRAEEAAAADCTSADEHIVNEASEVPLADEAPEAPYNNEEAAEASHESELICDSAADSAEDGLAVTKAEDGGSEGSDSVENDASAAQSPYRLVRNRPQRRRAELVHWGLSALIGVLAALFVLLVWFSPLVIGSASMEPTIRSGNTVLFSRFSKFFAIPGRSDLVVFRHPETNELLVKRIVGLPNESVSIVGGTVYIDGRYALNESDYANGFMDADMAAVTVPKDAVFVLSDDRAFGNDSRDFAVGCIAYDDIIGVVRVRINDFAILD